MSTLILLQKDFLVLKFLDLMPSTLATCWRGHTNKA